MKLPIVVLLFVYYTFETLAQSPWSEFWDKNQDHISLINQHFGSDFTYIGTREISGTPYLLLLENESVKKMSNYFEATVFQIKHGIPGKFEGVMLTVLCDCKNHRMKFTFIQEIKSDAKGPTGTNWVDGIGDSVASRIIASICDPLSKEFEYINLIKEHGTYKIPVTLNNAITEYFIFDTGASDLFISSQLATKLKNRGVLSEGNHLIKTEEYVDANGKITKCNVYLLESVRVGNRIVNNVECAVTNSNIDVFLLGQSFMEKLGKFEIDYNSNLLILK